MEKQTTIVLSVSLFVLHVHFLIFVINPLQVHREDGAGVLSHSRFRLTTTLFI